MTTALALMGSLLFAGTSSDVTSQDHTQEAADFVAYAEWMFNTSLTEAQRSEVAALVADLRARGEPEEIKLVERSAEQFRDLANYPAHEVASLRESVEDEYVKAMRRSAGRTPLGKWILALRTASQKVVALGPPRLTQQAVAALREMLGPAAANALVRAYPKLTEPERRAIADAPKTWSRLRALWTSEPPSEQMARHDAWTQSALGASSDGPELAKRATEAIVAAAGQ